MSGVFPTSRACHWIQRAIDESGDRLFTAESGVAEIVIPPRSDLIGDRVFPGMLSDSGDFVILAIQRRGADVTKEMSLAVGDTLLVRGTWSALDESAANRDLLVVDEPDLVRRRTTPLGPRAWTAIAVLDRTWCSCSRPTRCRKWWRVCSRPGAMIVLRLVTLEQAYKAISWTTVILVAAMMPLSTAMRESGAAETIANALVQAVGNAGPYALLVGLFLLTASLGQLISNMATALIVSPIAISAAAGIGVSARPLLMTIAVSAAASFLTPVATPVNLMVQEPGRLSLRGLLETRPAAAALVSRRVRRARAAVLALLTSAVRDQPQVGRASARARALTDARAQ